MRTLTPVSPHSWNRGLMPAALAALLVGGLVQGQELETSATSADEVIAMLRQADRHSSGAAGRVDRDRARELFIAAADAGDPVAILRLAIFYHNGSLGFEENPSKAIELAQDAFEDTLRLAELDDPEAQFAIGSVFLFGVGHEVDNRRAAVWYERASRRHIWAAHNLGWMYRTGTGVEVDLKRSLDLYRWSAEQGNLASLYDVGVALVKGQGTDKDLEAGLSLMREAAEKGQPNAKHHLGALLVSGEQGVQPDVEQGLQWIEAAADDGLEEAMFLLGRVWREGTGVRPDMERAAQWFLRSAEAGHAIGANNIGWMYRSGRGVTKNLEEAIFWFKQALLGGEDLAYDNFVGMSREDELSDSQEKEIVAWLGEKAGGGDAYAKTMLAVALADGWLGVGVDRVRAVQLHQDAAAAGVPRAMQGLGFAYHNGWGAAKDERLGVQWYRRAAEAGNRLAASRLGDALLRGEGAVVDVSEGLRWLAKSAELNFIPATLELARIYDYGYYEVPPDLEQAFYWYEKAAAEGNTEAIGWLRYQEVVGRG